MATCNVLVSSAGRRVGLMQCIQDDLEALGVSGEIIAADMSLVCPARAHASRFVQVARVTDVIFAEQILAHCEALNVALLVPTIDPELPIYAALRDELSSLGTTVLSSGPETVRIAADKRHTWRWLRSAGLPTVDQWGLNDARASAGDLPYPLIAKPARGSASVGVRQVSSAEELNGLDDDADLLIQSHASGDEYTVDVWVDRVGRARCAVPRKRIEVRAGEVSKAVTTSHLEVVSIAQELAERLPDAFGPLTIQMFADVDANVHVIEINPRFGGGFPLSWKAGAHYPRWAIQDALERPYEPQEFSWCDDLVMLRYDAGFYVDRSELTL